MIFESVVLYLTVFSLSASLSSCISALIKQVNKSIDGTADDEEEGVPTEGAIRAGLELLKVKLPAKTRENNYKK